jgi:hypothetical protein
VAALRGHPLGDRELAVAAGWPDDRARARQAAETLVRDGLARWREGTLELA